MKLTPRHTATQALLQMEENEGYSNIVIDKALRAAGLDVRDAGLASTIFYGVLERRLPLEHSLRGCLANPQKKLDPQVWALLLCAAYQILYLDRVPDSAAVNEAVEEAKGIKGGAFAGLVNGVLRSLARKKAGLSLPQGTGSRRGLRYSIPGTHRPVAALLQEELTAHCWRPSSAGPAVRNPPLRATAGPTLLGRQGFSLKPETCPGRQWQRGGSPASLRSSEGVPCAGPSPAGLLATGSRPGQVCDCCPRREGFTR
ncbi:MAG: transcription antitermination factor NusB [Acutalibacter sp.]